MPPKVSICLPNFNNYRYLPERIDSILVQTFRDWELIIVDSYSNDGAWELIQTYGKKDSRIRVCQLPKAGIYAGINACLNLAQGELIYIATSDDTMMPHCLEKMVQALEHNPDCMLCQCSLKLIDGGSNCLPLEKQWQTFGVGRYLGPLLEQPHKRFAPHDGVLHFAVGTVYTSLTQLLIRRQLFDEIGYFKTDLGSTADFEWGMRAALLYNVCYVPQALATWRIHSEQATGNFNTVENLESILVMCRSALRFAQERSPNSLKKVTYSKLSRHYKIAMLTVGINHRKRAIEKTLFFISWCTRMPGICLQYLLFKVTNRQFWLVQDPICWIKSQMRALQIPMPSTK